MSDGRGVDIVPVLPGAASLGAYQAGAAAAVVAGRNALRTRGHDVELPAWGGASAGATVALLAAHCLAQGLDPVAVLRTAWVERVDLQVLTQGSRAPLGLEDLREGLRHLLTGESLDLRPAEPPGRTDVAIHIALTTLRGYRYLLDDLGTRPVDAVTYADWTQVRYPAGGDPGDLCRPDGSSALDLVIASAANPAVFPPRVLDRSGAFEDYEERDLHDVAENSSSWWFVDGGLVQSRPIQRTLAMVPASKRQLRCVVIDPRSEGPSTGSGWGDPERDGEWLRGLMRAMSIFPAQVLSDELRRIDEANRTHDALAELAPLLRIADEDAWNRWARDRDLADADDRVLAALLAAAGLPTGRRIEADVIHPRLVADSRDVEGLLAGELLGDFAGFLSHDLRDSDFSLGFACGAEWWSNALDELGFGEEKSFVAERLTRVGPPPWERIERGKTQLSDLPMRAKFRLGRVALRALRATLWR